MHRLRGAPADLQECEQDRWVDAAHRAKVQADVGDGGGVADGERADGAAGDAVVVQARDVDAVLDRHGDGVGQDKPFACRRTVESEGAETVEDSAADRSALGDGTRNRPR